MKRCLFGIIILVLLTGCWDINQPNQMVYVHGIGVDYEDGQYTIILSIINLAKLAKTEGGSGGEEASESLAIGTGSNINEAIFKMYRSSQRRLYWGQLAFVVVTEKVLREKKVFEVIDILNRYHETRYHNFIYATKDPIERVMEGATMIVDISHTVTRLANPQNTYQQSSYVQETSLRELLIQLNEPGFEGIIPVASANETTWRPEGNPELVVEMNGVAVISRQKFHGFITGEDADGLRWMTKQSNRNNIQIEKDGKSAAVMIVVKPNISIEPVVNGSQVTFNVDIKADSVISEMIQFVDDEFIKNETEKEIKKEIRHTYVTALEKDSDIYGLSEVLYRKNMTAWKKVEQNGKVPLNEGSLKINVDIEVENSSIGKVRPIVDEG
mgnify:CR=1 FL=1